jgi:hypothetical protein
MKRYGDPYVPDTSPLKLNWEKSCVLRHLPSLDEVTFCWSETNYMDIVAVSVIPGYGDENYVMKFPQITLREGEFQTMTRAVGREMFNYLVREKGCVKIG